MPEIILTPDQIRLWEKNIINAGMSSIVLMENAAKNAAAEICKLEKPCRTVVVCGSGNNGGDGLAVARHLLIAGFDARAAILFRQDTATGDTAENLRMAKLCGVPVAECPTEGDLDAQVSDCDIIIDAIFGNGLNREIAGMPAYAVYRMNMSGKRIYSIDVPSGIDCESGHILGVAVSAFATITFQFVKTGLLLYPGREHAGKIIVCDIGVPRELLKAGRYAERLTSKDISAILPKRRANTNKGDYGRVGVIAGSAALAGAGAMSARAALRTGCGLLTLIVPASLEQLYHTLSVEAMTYALADDNGKFGVGAAAALKPLLQNMQAVALGPGWGAAPGGAEIIETVLKSDIPAVIDADALNIIGRDLSLLEYRTGPLVLTPHPGEMARLTGWSKDVIVSDMPGAARTFAREHGCVVLLKGATSVIASPDGHTTFNTTGNAGLAKGGSGDCLTGIIASLMAQGVTAYDAARAGSWILGTAGELAAAKRGLAGVIASDVIDCIGDAIPV